MSEQLSVSSGERPRILVIKLGALGDFILSYRAMTAIRAHHRDARLTLLTIPGLRGLAETTGLFDEIWTDDRPAFWRLFAWWRLKNQLNGAGFARVYDLQTADRTGHYYRLMCPPFSKVRPQWSGNVAGCAFPHCDPARETVHTLERQAEQLSIAGIGAEEYPPLDTSWALVDVGRYGLGRDSSPDGAPYVLIVPGGSAGHPEKRWPAQRYAELAKRLISVGIRPVVLGTAAERAACATISSVSSAVVNLCDDSPILEVMSLASEAAGAVGNDTGPMHLIAAMGCPSLVLFSGATDPALTRPRGPYEGPGRRPVPPGGTPRTVAVLRRQELAALTVDEVRGAMLLRGQKPPRH
jgi:ADP-heptose:LPS heptosyltransferase